MQLNGGFADGIRGVVGGNDVGWLELGEAVDELPIVVRLQRDQLVAEAPCVVGGGGFDLGIGIGLNLVVGFDADGCLGSRQQVLSGGFMRSEHGGTAAWS